MDTVNYFIAESELPLQIANKSYGAVSSSQYRVTSLFTGGDNPMAYAVTNGKIFIVNQSNNPDRINLLLKPESLLYGAPVKYFVYRGLLKSDFLDDANSYEGIKPISSDDSELIKKLRKGQNGELALKLYSDLTDDYFIDDIFTKDEYQFALVNQGDSIGRFDSQLDYGFEIMLDETFFAPTFALARKEVNSIDVSTITDEEEVSRLQVLNYIDPAAYYGLFSHNAYSIGTNNTVAPKSRRKEGVYEFIKQFITKNTVYIDIRDKLENPIDWFEDNTKNIKITTDGASALSSTEVLYRDANQFPIKTLTTGFSNVQTSNLNQKYFTIKLCLSTLDNDTPLLSLNTGYWLKFVSQIKDDTMFSVCTNNSGWTDDKSFVVFGVNDTNTDVPIATYLRLQLEEYQDIDAITNQLPDTVEESNTGFYTEGLFAFHMEGLPEYQEPIN